ncbi:MAG: DUF262 domain-containing protein [Nitrospirae bacterium]|nr:DUF262 domain-containing protein [Nitrospirota bacterium]MBF0592220.1 DUF262 domain-containing protein [Nitrospirota bacterium]
MSELIIDDIEIEGGIPEEADVLPIDRYDFVTYHSDMELSGWIKKIEKETDPIKIPSFQRAFKWEKAKASKLIESFLLGLPVPPIFIYQEKNTNRSLIIDGQQRLLSIYFFYKGLFPKHNINLANLSFKKIFNKKENFEEFKLECVRDTWNGQSYEELNDDDKRWLDDRVLWAVTVRQIQPDDTRSMFYIFERLNTGGLLLTPMEIRKAIYYGNFYELLEILNKSIEWKKLTRKPIMPYPDEALSDTEWILRFFSLHNWQKYKEPMKEFLNEYMRNNKELTEPEYNQKKEMFENTCKLIHKSLGDTPFHIVSGKLNLALLDSFMVIVSKYSDKLNEQYVKQLYDDMQNNDEYMKNIKSRVNVVEEVLKTRFDILESLVKKLLHLDT